MRSRVYVIVGRPSVRLCARQAGDIDRLLHGRRSAAAAPQHGAQQQMRAVSRLHLMYQEAEHLFARYVRALHDTMDLFCLFRVILMGNIVAVGYYYTPQYGPIYTGNDFWLVAAVINQSVNLFTEMTPHTIINITFSANPSHRSLLFFFFRTDSTDSPDCLPILLSISVFYFLEFLFSTF